MSGPLASVRWWRACISAVMAIVLMLVCSSLASAAPADPAGPSGGAQPADPGTPPPADSTKPANTKVDNAKWPAALNWVIPGTTEFKAKYMAGTRSLGETALAGCDESAGGDAWGYTTDFFNNFGTILDAEAAATGKPVLALDQTKIKSTPWSGLSQTTVVQVYKKGDGETFYAGPGPLKKFETIILSGGQAGPCGNTFKAYGTASADAPFGFGFYQQPDPGSVQALKDYVLGLANPGKGQEPPVYYWGGFGDPKDSSTADSTNPLLKWDYNPTKITEACNDPDNIFCLTASYLRCPSGAGSSTAETAAIEACRTWNINVAIMNQYLALTLVKDGLPTTGKFNIAAALTNQGSQAPLDAWLALAVAGKTVIKGVTALWVTLGATVLIGGLIAGGIPGLLIAAGVIAVAGAVLTQGIFGAVKCAVDFSRCMASATSDSMMKSISLAAQDINSVQVPDMTTKSLAATWNRIAGISLVLVLVFFLLTLVFAAVNLRPSMIWQALGGVVGWGVVIGLGGVFLLMLINLRESASQALASSGTGSVMSTLGGSVKDSLVGIAADPNPGLLLCAIVGVVGTIAGFLVKIELAISNQWIPLIVGIMLIQAAGLVLPGAPRKWFHRGFVLLWTLLFLKPIVLLVWRIGAATLSGTTGYNGLIAGVLILLSCAFAPSILIGLFHMGFSGRLGLGSALLAGGMTAMGMAAAGSKLAGGAAARESRSRSDMNSSQLRNRTDDGESATPGDASTGLSSVDGVGNDSGEEVASAGRSPAGGGNSDSDGTGGGSVNLAKTGSGQTRGETEGVNGSGSTSTSGNGEDRAEEDAPAARGADSSAAGSRLGQAEGAGQASSNSDDGKTGSTTSAGVPEEGQKAGDGARASVPVESAKDGSPGDAGGNTDAIGGMNARNGHGASAGVGAGHGSAETAAAVAAVVGTATSTGVTGGMSAADFGLAADAGALPEDASSGAFSSSGRSAPNAGSGGISAPAGGTDSGTGTIGQVGSRDLGTAGTAVPARSTQTRPSQPSSAGPPGSGKPETSGQRSNVQPAAASATTGLPTAPPVASSSTGTDSPAATGSAGSGSGTGPGAAAPAAGPALAAAVTGGSATTEGAPAGGGAAAPSAGGRAGTSAPAAPAVSSGSSAPPAGAGAGAGGVAAAPMSTGHRASVVGTAGRAGSTAFRPQSSGGSAVVAGPNPGPDPATAGPAVPSAWEALGTRDRRGGGPGRQAVTTDTGGSAETDTSISEEGDA